MSLPLPIDIVRKCASPSVKQPGILAACTNEQLEQIVMMFKRDVSDMDIAKQIQRTFKVGLNRKTASIRNAVFAFRHRYKEKLGTDEIEAPIVKEEKQTIQDIVRSDWKEECDRIKNLSPPEQAQALIGDLWEDYKLWRSFAGDSLVKPNHIIDLARLLKDSLASWVEIMDKFGMIEKPEGIGERLLSQTQVNQMFIMFEKNIDDKERVGDMLTTARNELELIAETVSVPELPEGLVDATELQSESCAPAKSPRPDESVEQPGGAEPERKIDSHKIPTDDPNG